MTQVQSLNINSQPTETTAVPVKTTKPGKRRAPKILIVIGMVLLLLIAVGGISAAVLGSWVMRMKPIAQETMASGQQVMTSIQSQDLVGARTHLVDTQKNLEKLQNEYKSFSWLGTIPLVGKYFQDGEHGMKSGDLALQAGNLFVDAIEPYSDLLGFKTASSAAAPKVQSAEDRIVFLVETLDKIAPQLDNISAKLKEANDEANKIDPKRYPTNFQGKNIQEKVIELQNTLSSTSVALGEARPLISLLPSLLGQTGEKQYMLLFQNNAELRPTGGFWTAYAFIKVSKGKITPLDSYDIYTLDAKWGKKLPAPDPIKKYLPLVNNWNLRDMNLSPDFKTSIETFLSHYRDIPNQPRVDGVIAIDTQVPVAILKIIGPIGVGGWGNFSADNDKRCDCAQVVYALEEIADRPVNTLKSDRKAVLGPLMHSLLANAMGSPKHLWPQLLNSGLDLIKSKHIIFYFPEDNMEKSAEAFGAAGRVVDFQGDYLNINDSNFGGAKSNMFINEDVEQEYEMAGDGSVSKTVTITYNNPHVGSNCNLEAGQLCLNGTYRDWVRVYVPKGSTLDNVVGSEVKSSTSEDLGKTVFDAFFTLRPQSSSKLVFKYKLPGTYKTPLPLLIQKQPGTDTITHRIIFNGQPQTIELVGDTTIQLR